MNWKDIGLRFIWTVVAAVMGAIGAVEYVDMAVVNAAWMAGLVAALSFVMNLAKDMLEITRSDSWISRIGLTFAQSACAALIAVPVLDMDAIKAAFMVAFIAAANVLTLSARQFAAPKAIK